MSWTVTNKNPSSKQLHCQPSHHLTPLRFLIFLLHVFTAAMGTTTPKPHEERKYAIFLAILLLAMMGIVFIAMLLVWQIIR